MTAEPKREKEHPTPKEEGMKDAPVEPRGCDGIEVPARERDGRTACEHVGEGAGVDQREAAVACRERAVDSREEAAHRREEAVSLREEGQRTRATLEQIIDQVREVNQQLVLASLRAEEMAEEAERLSRQKDDFLAMVTHELRTPLNAVLGWTTMLSEHRGEVQRLTHACTVIQRNAALLAHIVDDLMDLSRMADGRLELTAEPVDVVEVTEAAIDAVRTAANERSIDIRLSSDSSATDPITADPTRLQQVIVNLLSNAIKFSFAGGRVDVSISRTAANVEIAVSDAGQGIGEEFLPQVFDRFRRTEGAMTMDKTGLGLGLAIVRRVVELHGGAVRAESAGAGKGSTFTVTLPADASTGSAARRSSTRDLPRQPQRLDGLRILIVEQNAASRELMSKVLEHVGARVTAASSVEEALIAVERVQPDILVCDVDLPQDDGYTLVREIRQRETADGRSLPAIALISGHGSQERERAAAAGFNAELLKPVEALALTRAIASLAVPARR